MIEAENIVPVNRSKGKKRWKTLEMPSREYLLHIFRYEPETGKLFRRSDRPRSDFKGNRGYARYIRDFAGREAGAYKCGKKTGDPHCVYVRFDTQRHVAHRIIWVIHYGSIPCEKMIDHINGNPFDNRLENLRLVTSYQNQWNAKPQYRRKNDLPKGVCKSGNRFLAKTLYRGCPVRIGLFDTPEEASAAYISAVAKLRGEFNRQDAPPMP